MRLKDAGRKGVQVAISFRESYSAPTGNAKDAKPAYVVHVLDNGQLVVVCVSHTSHTDAREMANRHVR